MRRRDKAASSGSAQHHGWIAGSCGDWLEARRTHSAIALEAWMIGYVTGFNITCVSAPDLLTLSGMTGNSVYAWTVANAPSTHWSRWTKPRKRCCTRAA